LGGEYFRKAVKSKTQVDGFFLTWLGAPVYVIEKAIIL
jgi:hypothetical protein